MTKKTCSILMLILIILTSSLLIGCGKKSKTEYKVSFDTDGGTKIDAITVKEDNAVDLPKDPTKEGYTFDGWYLDGKKFDEKSSITKDITLKASWLKKEVEKIVVTFDSKGGSKVNSITINKGESLKLPKNPTRKGYKFITWKDDNEVPISNGANLDSSIKLYAYWEKVKSYSCKDPKATLKGDKCIKEERNDVVMACPNDAVSQKGKCFNSKDRVKKEIFCKKENGQEGTYYSEANGCFYGLQTGPYGSPFSKDTCDAMQYHYIDGKCYSKYILKNYEIKCPKGYALFEIPNNNPTCARLVDSIKKCEDGYKLSSNKDYCYKITETKAVLK